MCWLLMKERENGGWEGGWVGGFFVIYNSMHCGFFLSGLGDIIYIIYRGLKLFCAFCCLFFVIIC